MDKNKKFVGIIILNEESLNKSSFIKRLYGLTTLLILVFLMINFINFIYKLLSNRTFLKTIVLLSGKNFFHFGITALELIYITVLFVFFLLICFIYLLINQRVGLIKEIKGFGRRFLMTFSEAFYVGFLVSLVLILLAPLNAPTTSVPIPVVLYYGFIATVYAPFFEEFIFRLLFLLVPITIKEKMGSEKRRALDIMIRGKDEIDRFDMVFAIVSSLAFGFAHLWGGWQFNKLFQATFLGLFLAYIAIRGGIVSSIVFHWAWNTLATFIVIILVYDQAYQLSLLLVVSLLYFIILGLGILGIIVLIIRRFSNIDI